MIVFFAKVGRPRIKDRKELYEYFLLVFFLFLLYNLIMKIFTKRKILVFFLLLVVFFILNIFNTKELFYSLSENFQLSLWKVNSNCDLVEDQELISLMAENEELQRENKFLKDSLGLKDYPEVSVISGRIISKDYLSDNILINSGSKDGVKIGFPVVIGNNILIGRVSEVYNNYSRVKLLSLKDNLTDVSINGIVALAKGKGSEVIALEMFPRDKELKEGDIILTSSLGGNYPAGLVIGKVKNPKKIDNEPFQISEIEKAYNLFSIDRVSILKVTQIFND
ncbi:MAG: rod shape-determining protein MreC [Patescibacteria group bacterium]|nr:rod shape-determining protein MreC [Patescibacteria group bacterium]